MRKINISDLNNNIFDEFNKGWALLTAGNKDDLNTMTISWGQCGHLWHRNICSVYVRPTRYTNKYMDNNDYFTVSFFKGNNRKELAYLGRVSGRDENKIEKSGLNVIELGESVAFKEASYVLVCKKIYKDNIDKNNFIDPTIDNEYPLHDYHDVYIGEIVAVYEN